MTLGELYDLKAAIESEAFQVMLMDPLKDELAKLKNAYDCDSLRELNVLKGKKQGLMVMFKLLKQVETDIKNKRFELEQSGDSTVQSV